METVVIVVHLIIVLALVVLVLVQRSEGGALGIGGGSGGGGFMSGRGQANVLTKATALLAFGFFATSIALTVIARIESGAPSLLDQIEAPANETAPAIPQNENLLDTLGGSVTTNEPSIPNSDGASGANAPAVPAEPQIPSAQ